MIQHMIPSCSWLHKQTAFGLLHAIFLSIVDFVGFSSSAWVEGGHIKLRLYSIFFPLMILLGQPLFIERKQASRRQACNSQLMS